MIYGCTFDAPVGKMTLAASEDGLVGAWFVDQKHYGSGLTWEEGENEILRQAKAWLNRYFVGQRPDPAKLPLKPIGSPFRQAVWQILLQIPYGETVTYAHIDRMLRRQGISSCSQAVGGAVGHNPISIIIPCHRVVGTGGKLTGYAGGIEKKVFLLEHEKK